MVSGKGVVRLILVGVCGLLVLAAGPAVKWFDRVHGQERLRDAFATWWWHEDWSALAASPAELDYRWLHASAAPLRIAHALGASGTPEANTLAAADAAIKARFRILEVDLWLDAQGSVRCHHGPDAPLSTSPECRLDDLAGRLERGDAWLVLDIKTSFAPTAEAALAVLARHGMTGRAVLELYRPEHMAAYLQWRQRYGLPGPIVAVHLAHRGVAHVAWQARQAGVQALSVPLGRLPGGWQRPAGLSLLVHPVHDCDALRDARRAQADGMFMWSRLAC